MKPGARGVSEYPLPAPGRADRVPYRELVVAVAEADVVGSVCYLTPDGAWYVPQSLLCRGQRTQFSRNHSPNPAVRVRLRQEPMANARPLARAGVPH